MSLRAKMLLSFSLLSLAALAAMAWVDVYGLPFTKYQGEIQEHRETAFLHLDIVANLMQERLLRWIDINKQTAQALASSTFIQSAVAELVHRHHRTLPSRSPPASTQADLSQLSIQQLLTHQLSLVHVKDDTFLSVAVADRQSGIILASSRAADVGQSVAGQATFAHALGPGAPEAVGLERDPENDTLTLVISRAIKPEGQGQDIKRLFQRDSQRIITAARPEDPVQAVLMLRLDLPKRLLIPQFIHAALGETTEAVLTDRKGLLVAPLQRPLANGAPARSLVDSVMAETVQRIAVEQHAARLDILDYRGTPVLATGRLVPVSPETTWVLLVKQDRHEVFGPLQAFLSVGLTVKATGLALFLLLTGVVAHNLSRPLRQLSQAASQVAAGNLDARARVRGRGELGLLGATFDAMVERIQRWHRDLNAEVEARKHAEEELQELLRFERLMTQISTEFAAMPAGGFLLVVDQEVRRLMEFLKADRAWLVEFVGEEARSMMHKTEGAVSTPQSFAPDQLPWCMAELRERRRLHFSTLEDLPAAAALDRKVLEEIRVRSMLALPLSVSGEVLGGFIFAVTTQRCAWPAPVLQRIQLVEDLFANLLRQFRSEQALTEAETRFHTVANFMQDWEYWRRPDGSLQFCSSACERITGYGPEQFLANGQLFAEIVLPEDAHLWQAHECKVSDHSHTHLSTLELRIRRADGQVRWIEHTCRPVVTKQGEFLGIRAANRDVTIPKLAELETQRLREELSRMTRVTTLDHLAASLSHELRQPLTAIMSNAEAAEQFLSLPTPDLIEVREALRDVIRNSEHAGAVIQRLRSLYRKTSRQEQSTLDVNQLIEDTLDLLRSELILRQVTCYMELTPGLPAVSAVRVEVQQVLLNLTLNALDAMSDLKPETRQLAIKTTIEEPRSVSVIVRDTGPGIHPTVADRLFEPFMTTKAAGMGLGLAISRAIIEAHGGRIWATNNSRRGASLHFTLPVFKGN